MIRLLEDRTKAWLRAAGLPVPKGARATSAEEVATLATQFGGDVVVKALVPAGRRGKAGGVVRTPVAEAAAVAARMLGSLLGTDRVGAVYVEQAVEIREELYLAFLFDHDGPRVVASRSGGVDIESVASTQLLSQPIDAVRGLPRWSAIDLWHRAGVDNALLRELGTLTSELYAWFVAHDAEMLEINPLAVDAQGHLVLVGAMVGLDADARGRHSEWPAGDIGAAAEASDNPREMRVGVIDASVAGGECRYVELDGDIGLLVGGGGAGLYQHDRLLASGGRPANHSVTPPTGADNRKLKAVIEAIVENPRARALLVGFNFAQMARADIRVRTLFEVLDDKGIDTAAFPVVIRLFGAGEEDARARAAGRPGVHYLPRDASLDDAIRLVVALAAAAPRATPA